MFLVRMRVDPGDDEESPGGLHTGARLSPADGSTKRSGEPTSPVSQSRPSSKRGWATLETDRYTPHEEIGRGGSSVVIRAFDKEILRFVAVKILDLEPAVRDALEVDRFAEEARITGQLEHPNIVPVYDLGRDRRGRWFLAMKLVEGETLETMLGRLSDERLAPRRLGELLQIFSKVCDAVSFAHNRGIVHRDIKPRNIMMSEFGQVYVLDWGIARVRSTEHLDPLGLPVGTHGYMAPEQLRGQHGEVDGRADVFALGAVLYEILAGVAPVTTPVARAILSRSPPPPIADPGADRSGSKPPPELVRIAMRALSYEPSQRYGSVAEMKDAIESFQRGAWDVPQVTFRAGQVIIREGEPGDAAYVIVEGRCLAYRRESERDVELRMMHAGDVFGEMAVFSRKPRSASVRAVDDTVVLKVREEELSRALGLSSWMGVFVRALAERFREADERLRSGMTASSTNPGLP
jgi:serine/threonine-protein kinase